jgi:hypothetical protein
MRNFDNAVVVDGIRNAFGSVVALRESPSTSGVRSGIERPACVDDLVFANHQGV